MKCSPGKGSHVTTNDLISRSNYESHKVRVDSKNSEAVGDGAISLSTNTVTMDQFYARVGVVLYISYPSFSLASATNEIGPRFQ